MKEFKQKYEISSKQLKTSIPDKKVQDNLTEVIRNIEELLSNKLTNLKRLDTGKLAELEQLYVRKETELSRRVDVEIEKHERERAIELMREREEREARNAREVEFAKEIGRVSECIEQMRQNGAALKTKLESFRRASDVGSEGFLPDIESMSSEVDGHLNRVGLLKDKLKSLGDPKKFSDDEIDRNRNELSNITVQCMAKQNDLLGKMKTLEARVQQHLDRLLNVIY